MVAYKIWHNERNYIHKDTTNDLNVSWTTDIKEAKTVNGFGEAVKFFFDLLGFSLNPSKYDALHLS